MNPIAAALVLGGGGGGGSSVEIVDNLNSTATNKALSANQGRVLNNSLGGKADLEGGKVPLSQLPSFITADVLEFPTFADFPATGTTGKIYVAKDTGKSYKWVGSNYVEISEPNQYYSVTPSGTTMGELRASINQINNSGMHVFFDMHNYLTDGYVCTVHMYTVNNVNYCQILDLIEHRVVFCPSGYADSTTVVNYCSTSSNLWHTARDIRVNGTTIITDGVANITDATLQQVKYAAQTLTDGQKTQARTNIAAIGMEEYNSSATTFADNTLYFVTE